MSESVQPKRVEFSLSEWCGLGRFERFGCPPDTIGHGPDTFADTKIIVFEPKTAPGRPDKLAGHVVNSSISFELKRFLAISGTPLCPDTVDNGHDCARGGRLAVTPWELGRLARLVHLAIALLLVLVACPTVVRADLRVGFAEADITPEVKKRDVWLAGYGQNRRAKGVHDPLFVRAVVFKHGKQKIAMACADVVGVMLPTVDRIRTQLKDFDYVMVSATHNHEGPDTVGLWGRSPVETGVDPDYMKRLISQTVASVRAAEKNLIEVEANYGTADNAALLNDSRLPKVFDARLRVLRFARKDTGKTHGVIVQWNCHPEAMGSKNLQVTADFVATTVSELKKKHDCPVAYFSGPVGGLLAPPRTGVANSNGKQLHTGSFEYTDTYGRMVAALADQAIERAQPITLTPFKVRSHRVNMPLWNPMYMLARRAKLIERDAYFWTGDAYKRGKMFTENITKAPAIETEVAVLRLGQLHVACIPGEIYPELVNGHIQDPPDKGADFKDAPKERHIHALLPDDRMLIIGLANDEIGYIIPKRQWDAMAPFAYGRSKVQYGEINSVGPEVAPIIMAAIERCLKEMKIAKDD